MRDGVVENVKVGGDGERRNSWMGVGVRCSGGEIIEKVRLG